MNRSSKARLSSPPELPQELLEAIYTRLETQPNLRSFRAVCKSWKQSVPLSRLPGNLPLSPVLPLNLSFSKDSSSLILQGQSATLVASSVFLLRPADTSPEKSKINNNQFMITVEDRGCGKLLLRRPLSRVVVEHMPENFPRVLDLCHFDVSEISRSYFLRLKKDHDLETTLNSRPSLRDYFIRKVCLFVNPACSSDYTVVVLDRKHGLHAVRLPCDQSQHKCIPIRKSISFDDIVNFLDEVYAIDRKGRVYAINYDNLKVRTVVDALPATLQVATRRKKWLVESSGRLYLVRRTRDHTVRFEVYELDLSERRWNVLQSLGEDRVLFVTFDGCFFVSTKDLGIVRGNCIVFYRGCFYSTDAFTGELDTDIFRVVSWIGRRGYELDLALYRYNPIANARYGCSPIPHSYSLVLWPPPSWLFRVASSSIRTSIEVSRSDSDNTQQAKLNHELPRESSLMAEPEDEEEQRAENNTPSYQHETTHGETQIINTISRASTSTPTETCRTFEELNIKADLIPTLGKIWEKHGNIIEGVAIRNGDILARALESLATVVETLQSCSGSSLEDDQADYVSSALFDLQYMKFNVDWLVPSVEKALALHRSKL